jgi:hypothetical protein
MYSIPACIGINTRIMIRAYIYIVFYSALIFVCNAYSYDTRIRMIGVFVWYARSYDTRIFMMHAFVDDTRISVFNWLWYAYDTSIIPVSYVKIYASDTLLFETFLIFAWEMSTMRTNLMVTRSAQNAGKGISGLHVSKIFRRGMPPDPLAIRGLWKCYGQNFGWIRPWRVQIPLLPRCYR